MTMTRRELSKLAFAAAVVSLSSFHLLSAPARIDDPKAFVTEVYRLLMVPHSTYAPPEDIFTPSLQKLVRDDKRKAKGEVGCLDFDFWVNGQDWTITNLNIAASDEGPDKKTIIAKFINLGDPQEIHFDFRRTGGRWLLNDAQSLSTHPWTLSEILKCAH